jgi:rhodanese-related sulfurtransferase
MEMADRTDLWISAVELHAQMQDSATPPLIIDVRSQPEFQSGHIPDAIHIAGDVLLESIQQISNGQPLVLYSNMRQQGASRSEQAAGLLRSNGFQVQVLDGGFPAWEAADYPVERGRQFHQIGKV